MNMRINHKIVWILIVVYFLIGWGWYSNAIFGDIWLNQHAKTATDIERTHTFGPYVLAFVGAIVINYVLAILLARSNPEGPWCGVKLALALWIVLFLEYATISVFSAFETNPWPLICIDMGRPLIGLLISGFVLGRFRKA